MSIIVSNCQHCDEQQFQTLSYVHYTIFSEVKLDLFIQALLLDDSLALEKTTRTSYYLCKCALYYDFLKKGIKIIIISIIDKITLFISSSWLISQVIM